MKRNLLIAGAAFFAALFLFSGFMFCREYADSSQSADAFESLADLVLEESAQPEQSDNFAAESGAEVTEPQMTAFEKYAAVYEQNSDLVGWIAIDGTNINYPVMQTPDNPNFYLKHSFDKKYSNYGVPYVQENCALGISDNIVIYGHHMNDGSMFADLCKYESEDFYREHKTIRFDTLSGFGEYEIVTVFKTVAYSEAGFKYYHFVNAEDKAAFDEFLAGCNALRLYDTGVNVEYGDKLITLSPVNTAVPMAEWSLWQRKSNRPPRRWTAMPEIKTRDVVKGTVKAIDKSAVAAERMKDAYIRTKDKAEHGVYSAESSPDEYAADRLSGSTETTVRESAHQLDKFGRKGVKTTKENISKAKEHFQQKKTDIPKKQAQKQAEKRAGKAVQHIGDTVRHSVDTAHRANDVRHSTNTTRKAVKTFRGQKTIKQTAKSTGKATAKTAKGTVKTAQRSVKTAERTAKTAIKTTQQAAKTAQRTAQATARAAKAAAQAARAAAKAAVATAKAAVKATIAAVKAIIAATKALIAAIAAGGWVAVVVIIVICLIGLIVGSCFGIFFSNEDSGSGQTMQAVVQEINTDYQQQIDTTKANISYDVLEMSGSRAVWPEVLSVYAVKTTTDPDNAQEVATMDDSKKAILKDIFWQMNQISSRTETKSEEVITETDDGHGNIVESKTTVSRTYLYITVSHKTAAEMANQYNFSTDQRKQLAELLADENRSMWSAVLYGIGTGDGEIVTVALSQIGNVGGEPYWSWYGFNSRVEWCACFVSWCANECGYIDAGVIPKFAGCVTGSQWFKDRGLWQDRSYEPRPGDIIFFDWDNKGSSGPQDGLSDHVGIVEKVENGIVYTVEGNSGDSCRENHYAVGHYEILGYGTLCV